MSLTIKIDIHRSFSISLPRDKAFKVLTNVPFSAGQFPDVESFKKLADERFAWLHGKTGINEHELQVNYACDYQRDEDHFKFSWTPVPGFGNTEVAGQWQIEEEGKNSRCRLQTTLLVNMAAPAMLQMVISPVVRHTFNEKVDQYIANLMQAMRAEGA